MSVIPSSVRASTPESVAIMPAPTGAMNLKQAAAYLQVSKAHLLNATKGRIPGTPALRHARVGRRILFKRLWLDQWLEQIAKERNSW